MSHRREILVRHDHNRGGGFQRDIDLGASSEIEAMMKGVAWEQPDDELWEMLQLCYEGLTEIERLSVDAIVFGPHSFRKAAAILGCGVGSVHQAYKSGIDKMLVNIERILDND